MADIWMDVDVALSEVPVNILPLTDDTDFKTRETAITYDQAGMDLVWNFVTTAGVTTQTAVTPTSAGDYDWVNQGDGMYTIEIPASGGASINNDTEGFGWFTGCCTGVLPWRGPVIGFRSAALNNALIDGGDNLDVNTVQWLGTACATPTVAGVPEVDVTHIAGGIQTVTDLKDFADTGYDPSTHKVQGVVLTDTCTTNSDMRGTDDAALASVCTETRLAELDAANLPADIADIPTVSEFNARTLPSADYVVTSDTIAGIDTVTNIADAVWDEAVADHTAAGSFGEEVQAHALSSEISALNDISAAEVNAEVDTALSDYDAPTKAEMDSAFTEIKGATWSSTTDTLEHIRDKQTDIEADTNELQTDLTDGGRLDSILDDILTDTGTTLENHLTDIKGTGFVKDTDSLPQCLTATGFSTHSAADVKNALEAAGSDLDYLVKALVNKLVITEASGDAEMFDDANGSLGSVPAAFSSDGTYTIRKRMVI